MIKQYRLSEKYNLNNKNDPYILMMEIRSSILVHLLYTTGWQGYLTKYLGSTLDDVLFLINNRQVKLYYRQSSIKKFTDNIVKKIISDESFSDQLYNDGITQCDKLIRIAKKISQLPFIPYSNRQLAFIWQQYCDSYITWSPFLAIPNPYELIMTEKLQREIFKKNINQMLWQQLTYTPKRSALVQEQVDLLYLACLIKLKLKANIKNHIIKYQWLNYYNPDSQPVKKSFFIERLDKLLAQNQESLFKRYFEAEIKIENDMKRGYDIERQLKIKPVICRQLKFLRQLTYLKSLRMEAAMKSFYLSQNLFKTISQRFGLTLNQLLLFKPEEIKQILIDDSRAINKKIIIQRKKSAILQTAKMTNLFAGKESDIFFKIHNNQNIRINKIIQGKPACLGKVIGKVRIVNTKNINQFKQGEILVAKTTTPDYILAMAKAIGIVTDYGGITSHAAIVAREMKKPCIVGTGNATLLLNTGDMITIDANKGIVTKLLNQP